MENIIIWSNSFQTGEIIPTKYTCDGNDISPQLRWEGIPDHTQSILLIMEDPDAIGGIFTHWIIFNVPPNIRELPEEIPKHASLVPIPFGNSSNKQQSAVYQGINQGINDFGKIGYGGPCPPHGTVHRYFFNVYALDIKLPLPPGVYKRDIEIKMSRHILAKGELIGIYGR